MHGQREAEVDRDGLKRSLQDKLSVLTARVARIESHLRDPGSKDSKERASEVENDEVLERLDESEREEIVAIRAALDRIERGTYGVCVGCQEPIAEKRLEALPYSNRCVSCAD
jgi:RNA polymerase-binding protein DksA